VRRSKSKPDDATDVLNQPITEQYLRSLARRNEGDFLSFWADLPLTICDMSPGRPEQYSG